MSDSSALPTVLILGSVFEGTASALLCHLWGNGTAAHPRRSSFIRLVDKHLLVPQSDTFLRWVEPRGRKVLKDGVGNGVEYVQANIANAEARTRVFRAPGDKAFDIVYDFSTGGVNDAATEEVMVETVAKFARLLGLEALKYGGVGAYIRQIDPFVTQPKKKCPLREDDVNARPTSLWSKWCFEGSRTLADLKELNLVLARIANPYGPGCLIGLTRRLSVGAVYQYLGPSDTMELLWGKDLVLEHVHIDDIASSFYALANWMRTIAKTRARADELAGCPLPPCRPAALFSEEVSAVKAAKGQNFDKMEIQGLVQREKAVIAPMFNITDGSRETQQNVGKVMEQVLNIKIDYHSAITNALAKLNMSEVVEVADEKHTEPWLEMLAYSKPPISNTPLSPAVPPLILRKNRCHLDGSKIREIVGWTPQYPNITVEEVTRCIEVWKEDGIWPNAPPKASKKK